MFRRNGIVLLALVLILAATVPAQAEPARQPSPFDAFWSFFERLIPQFGTAHKSDEGPGMDPNGQDSGSSYDPDGLLSLPPGDSTGSMDPNGQDSGSSYDPNGFEVGPGMDPEG